MLGILVVVLKKKYNKYIKIKHKKEENIFDFKLSMMELLDTYYGESKSIDYKEEIINFINYKGLKIIDIINTTIDKKQRINNMADFEQDMMEILDDYYGNSRTSDHKEEIISFIDSKALEIRVVINTMLDEEGGD